VKRGALCCRKAPEKINAVSTGEDLGFRNTCRLRLAVRPMLELHTVYQAAAGSKNGALLFPDIFLALDRR